MIIILSIIWPGSGHFFVKKYKLGSIIFLVWILVDILFLQFLWSKYLWFIVYFVILAIVQICTVVNIILIYKKNKITLKYFAGIIILFIVIVLNIIYNDIDNKYYRFRTSELLTARMANTLTLGDKVVVDYNKNYKNNIQHGDILVYKYRDEITVARCIALENDIIEIIDNNVIINCVVTDEPYKNLDQKELERSTSLNHYEFDYDLPETIIRKNNIFILGDNRFNSADSRFIGQFSKDLVLGKVLYIYLSKDKTKIGKKLK
jgi:signal peptidase I